MQIFQTEFGFLVVFVDGQSSKIFLCARLEKVGSWGCVVKSITVESQIFVFDIQVPPRRLGQCKNRLQTARIYSIDERGYLKFLSALDALSHLPSVYGSLHMTHSANKETISSGKVHLLPLLGAWRLFTARNE